jgi:long-chain acyl-CoA synthetase
MRRDADPPRFVDDAGRTAAGRAGSGIACIALDGAAPGEPFERWLLPAGARPMPVEIRPGTPSTSSIQLRHHRHAQGHRAVARHALGCTCQRGAKYGYGPDTVTLLSTPLYSNTTLVVFFPTLAFGGAVLLMPKFDARLSAPGRA